jgi:hypothetical protein
MTEIAEQRFEAGHVIRTSDAAFEPEILSFCCEH